jgi:cell wall assembly regulator SMI1
MQRYAVWIDVWHNQPVLPERQLVVEVMEWAHGPLPTVAEQVASLMAEPAGTPCEGMYLPVWLPIAGSGMGLDLFVDLRPGPLRGCVMRFDRVGTARSKPDWPSVAAMLAEVADALEHGQIIGDDYPVCARVDEEGHLVWDQPA